MKKTKIICTIGPKTAGKEMLKEMIEAGMDVVRINLSHADHEIAESIINNIRELNKELKSNVGILIDIKGPKMRLINEETFSLKLGEEIVLTNEEEAGKLLVDYPNIILNVKKGDRILLSDGSIELKVLEKTETDLVCKVMNSGIIKGNASVNIPGVRLDMDFLSVSDKDDIAFASKMKADFISLSYVCNANDVLDVNDMLIGFRNEHAQLIAKIENSQAIEDIDNIIKVSDGIMIARGDLGVEMDVECLPSIQKEIVKKCYHTNKICIVATQMLASMEENPIPTRAEVSDVANAVIDGVDSVMLSGETAIGKYPIETIKVMNKIIVNIEKNLDYEALLMSKKTEEKQDITTVIAHSVVDGANRLKADAILVSTMSGYTARKVSNFRPASPIITITPNKEVARSLSLNWGIIPVISPMFDSTDEIVEMAIKIAKEKIKNKEKMKIIITGGFPITKEKATNFMKVEEIDVN
ncbi:MAG: pyruvate kinase [Bacilli bacterium]